MKFMITGRNLIERYYSDPYEQAFLEGYEYAQREFGNPVNKAAKRAWEESLGQRKGLNRLFKGKLPEAEAVSRGRAINDQTQGFRGFTIDSDGNHVFRTLNEKINEKAGGASYARLNQGAYTGKNIRGLKTKSRFLNHDPDKVIFEGKELTRQEFLKPNVMGKIKK